MNNSSSYSLTLVRALGYSEGHTFGPLWRDAGYVMSCLRRYCETEGHGWAFGRSAEWLAREFTVYAPYDGTGEQYAALACLLMSGCGAMVI